MGKIHLVANTFQIKELFKVLASYCRLRNEFKACKSLKCLSYLSNIILAYEDLSPRRCTLSYNVVSANSATIHQEMIVNTILQHTLSMLLHGYLIR